MTLTSSTSKANTCLLLMPLADPTRPITLAPVGENPIRLQRMLCRIMGYDLDFKYIKGKHLLIADALSRSHTTNHTRSQSEEEIETIGLVIQDQSVTSHLKEIAEETAKDNVLQSVIHHISENWSICKRRLPSILELQRSTIIQ